MLNIASLALALLATARPVTDTTITIKSGTRLVVDNFAGSITIDTWTKGAIRIRAEHSRRAELDIERSVARLDLSAHGKWGEPVFVDYNITVPTGTPIELTGIDTDIEVRGAEGPVKAETVKGDVTIKGAKGAVTCSSVEGVVEVLDTRGRVEASAVNDMVRVVGATGVVQAESVNGDVFLEQAKTSSVEASTVNGNIYYVGDIQKDGDYSFSTHQGSMWIGIPVNANCTGAVSTYDGSFRSTFPLETSEKKRHGGDVTFTIGEGSARLELEAFNGGIVLDRPDGVTQRIAQANQKREMRKAHKEAYDSDIKERELERKMEQKEKELERKVEQKEKMKEKEKDKHESDEDDKTPDPDPDVN
jgi:DUF4097 and DUF4098 domain-containing protein YvlB